VRVRRNQYRKTRYFDLEFGGWTRGLEVAVGARQRQIGFH